MTGFMVEVCTDDLDALRLLSRETFDAIVLDLKVPVSEGLGVLTSIRRSAPEVPVIIVSAARAVADCVAVLDAGAADAVPKPLRVEELAARVRAQIRRARTAHVLSASGIEIDLIAGNVRRDGVPIRLSGKERALLAHLIRRRGAVCPREQILSAVWGSPRPTSSIVDTYVSYLRRKLALPGRPLPLITVHGIGYRLAADRTPLMTSTTRK
jgi:DNA-binding response OmpR family regulator